MCPKNYFPAFVFAFLSASIPLSALAGDPTPLDPRNTSGYHVLFDLDAKGKTDLVNGYGAYLQWYDENPSHPFFRYCDNFEGKGLDGRPNLKRERTKFVPFGTVDDSAYKCHDYTPLEIALGRRLIFIGEKSFFAIKTARWDDREGGEILFQIAKKLPLIGSPTYRLIRVRATRIGGDWQVETLIPRGETIPTEWMHFSVSGSAFGLPNGINELILNPGRSERPIDLDALESARVI